MVGSSTTCVKVKKIEKVPSQYYTPNVTYVAKADTRVKIKLEDKTVQTAEQLEDALEAAPAVKVGLAGGIPSFAAEWWDKMKEAGKKGIHSIKYFLTDNAKRIAISGGASVALASIAGVVLVSTCSIAYQVRLGDKVIGTVKDESTYYQILSDVQEEVAEISEIAFEPRGELNVNMRLIPKGTLTDEEEIKEKLKSTSADMIPAYAVLVNSKPIMALPNQQMAIDVLEAYKKDYTGDAENVEVTFATDVEVAHEFVPKTLLKTKDSALDYLRSGQFETYTPAEGETLETVAEKYGVKVNDILNKNVVSDEVELSRQCLKIYTGKPLIDVKTVEHIKGEFAVPFETVQTEDETKYQGSIKAETEGQDGLKFLEAYVTKVNGEEVGKNVVQETMLKAPVNQVEILGTREVPAPVGTGFFAMPASGSLSSRFGSRWGRNHNGIDIAAGIGADVKAADTGRVIYSQYNDGGYGYLIQIDHGNGFVTYYGHCSELIAQVGDIVSKGDIIAKVGNTGNSTGPHLHFEVRKDGTPYDPLAYLND